MLLKSLSAVLLASSLLLPAACGRDSSSKPDSGSGGGNPDAAGSGSSIQDVQSESMPVGAAVSLSGVVIIAIDTYGGRTGSIYIMEPEGGAFSGVQVFLPGTEAVGLAVGDVIDLSGAVKDEFALTSDTSGRTLTELKAGEGGSIAITKTGTGTVPAPEVLNPWELIADDAEAEKWEGVLITFEKVALLSSPRNVTMSDPLLKEMDVTGPFPVSSGLTELADTLMRDDCLTSITGIGDYFFDYKLLPRSAADIVTGGTGCPAKEEGDTACGDSMDNDFNGFTDCEDFSCQDTVAACVSDTTIVEIQDGTVPSGAVSLSGVVVTAIDFNKKNLWVADAAQGAANNGVYVFRGFSSATVLPADVVVGAIVDIQARVSEFRDLTELTNPTLTVTAASPVTPLALTGISNAVLSSDVDGEVYEGVLVQIGAAATLNNDLGNNQFSVGDPTDPLVIDDEIYRHTAAAGDCFSSITGVMHIAEVMEGATPVRKRVLEPRSAIDVVSVTCR